MQKNRWIAFFMLLALLLPMLFACGDGNEKETKPGKKTETGTSETVSEENDWENVDFGGETLRVNVSVCHSTEQTFQPADIYSRGPDSLNDARDSVEKRIFDRNRNVEDMLHLTVEWQETDQPVGASQAVIENFVKQDAPNSPDIFINDVYDLIHAMLSGSLWNLLDPDDGTGNKLKSYFDFSSPCWYWEYMRGSTIRDDKVYVAAGDFFVDIIRFSYAIYVNRGLFDEVMSTQCITVHELYEDVLAGLWDYDTMEFYIEIGGRDTNGDGEITEKDESVGMITSAHLERAYTWSCGLSVLGWEGEEDGEKYNGKPYVMENNLAMFEYVSAFSRFYNTKGLMIDSTVLGPTVKFLDGNVLFALSMMGELESEQVRASAVNKGVLPLPKFSQELQPEYHTVVHDQAEIGCILTNAKHFTEATAYLQLINEESDAVLKEYYENSLKMRYNDDPDTKAMIDLIHGNIGTPFELIVARLVVSGSSTLPGAAYQGEEIFNMVVADAKERKTQFNSSYTSAVSGWKENLEVMIELFDELQ